MTAEPPSDAPAGATAAAPEKRRTCAFCGAWGPLTKEHVFGDWLSRLGLDSEPAVHRAGPLNRLGKDLGTGPMFARTVRNICSTCNNGWMSTLEQIAQHALRPLILGEPSGIAPGQQGALARWAQKTVMIAMLVSSEAERSAGYGLAESEYRALYELRDQSHPLPASTLWIGRYTGTRQAAVWVTPFAIHLDGLPEPAHPHGYAATIAVGQLIIHGTRFTAPGMDLELSTRQGMSQLWPPNEPVEWPQGLAVDETDFLRFAAGKDIQVRHPPIRLTPWGPAANLAQSEVRGSMIELPALCGKHVLYYPPALVGEAWRGRVHAFMASCECEQVYVVHIEADAAHFRAAGSAEGVAAIYDELPGVELVIEDSNGRFVCKRLNRVGGR